MNADHAAAIRGDRMNELKAPFPWFGGKRRVADVVWSAIGDVDNYVEPFAGSLAVLLARRGERWLTGSETVNDADGYLCNFWRALKLDPDAVARWADWPVNETDLFARHLWLVNSGKQRIEAMESDPEFYDAKVAGWWVWGISAWIGSGWCKGNGPWSVQDGKVVMTHGNAGRGVNRQLPHLGNAGRGVNRQLPHLGDAGRAIRDYFQLLSSRLRRVRVCCGDWSRVLMDGAMAYGETVGIFLDPPYQGDVRTRDLYTVDDHTISTDVREWAIAHGEDNRLRIVLAGYEEEHGSKMPNSWRALEWTGNKCYGATASIGSKKGNDANRHNERLWFSPGCTTPSLLAQSSFAF